jgi:hypothetical protein
MPLRSQTKLPKMHHSLLQTGISGQNPPGNALFGEAGHLARTIGSDPPLFFLVAEKVFIMIYAHITTLAFTFTNKFG